jgi:hypothetical protein
MTWEYLAGFFDGEGHVGVHKAGRYRQASVTVANTHEPTIDQIAEFLSSFGIGHSKFRRVYDNGKWKTAYKINVTGIKNSTKFLSAILPYLVTKREAALTTLEWLSKQTPRDFWSKESYERALAWYSSGKTLRQASAIVGMDQKSLRVYGKKVGFKFRSRQEAALAYRRGVYQSAQTQLASRPH